MPEGDKDWKVVEPISGRQGLCVCCDASLAPEAGSRPDATIAPPQTIAAAARREAWRVVVAAVAHDTARPPPENLRDGLVRNRRDACMSLHREFCL